MENSLQHYGILGMKWGRRRYQNKDGSLTPEGKARRAKDKKSSASNNSGRKSLKDMSDTELKEMIGRLELEKRYKDLSKSEERERISKGQSFVADVLEKSGKNIATQFTTYIMGTAVNKLAGTEIVNPKKGQKDK